MTLSDTISHLKHVYCPNLCVGSALILNQDPIFETASNRLLKIVKSKTKQKAEFMCDK